MRKIKKINGYLIVKFNTREMEKWGSTGLGMYGVIDAECYTGNLAHDRVEMQFDNAQTIEEAVDQARSLESEMDITDQETHITIVKEAGIITEETQIDVEAICDKMEKSLASVQDGGDCPDLDARAASYFRGGFYEALLALGIMEEDDERIEAAVAQPYEEWEPRERFQNVPRYLNKDGETLCKVGRQLETCERVGSCSVFYTVFKECENLDRQIHRVQGYARELLRETLLQGVLELNRLYHRDYEIRKFCEIYQLTDPEPAGEGSGGGNPINLSRS